MTQGPDQGEDTDTTPYRSLYGGESWQMEQSILQTSETPIDSRRGFDGWQRHTPKREITERCHGRFMTAHPKGDRITHEMPWPLCDRVVSREARLGKTVTSLTAEWARQQEEGERSDAILKKTCFISRDELKKPMFTYIFFSANEKFRPKKILSGLIEIFLYFCSSSFRVHGALRRCAPLR